MASRHSIPRLSFDAFFDLEGRSAVRHELVRGELFAMAGGTRAHNEVALAVASALKAHLKGKPCRAYMADVIVHVEAADASFYPDVVVTCSDRDLGPTGDKRRLLAPSLIVEVLSESTAEYDQGEKFADYRLLATLQEYVIIDSRSRWATVFRHEPDGWRFIPVSVGETLHLASVDFSIPLATVYDETDVPQGSRGSRALRATDNP